MTPIIYIKNADTIIIGKSELASWKVIEQIASGSWHFPIPFRHPKSSEIYGVVMVSDQEAPYEKIILTPRQQIIMEKIIAGKTFGQISLDLGISVSTVAYHWERIREKFKVQTRGEVISEYVRNFRLNS